MGEDTNQEKAIDIVKLARHTKRPTTLDYIKYIITDFLEINVTYYFSWLLYKFTDKIGGILTAEKFFIFHYFFMKGNSGFNTFNIKFHQSPFHSIYCFSSVYPPGD